MELLKPGTKIRSFDFAKHMRTMGMAVGRDVEGNDAYYIEATIVQVYESKLPHHAGVWYRCKIDKRVWEGQEDLIPARYVDLPAATAEGAEYEILKRGAVQAPATRSKYQMTPAAEGIAAAKRDDAQLR